MKLCNARSASIITRRPFAFIKGSRSSDPIDYLLCNQFEVHLSDEDSDKANGPQSIWPYFYWSIIHCKDICNHYSSGFIWELFFWNGVNGGLMRLYSNLRRNTTVFQLQSHNQYLWIELKT